MKPRIWLVDMEDRLDPYGVGTGWTVYVFAASPRAAKMKANEAFPRLVSGYKGWRAYKVKPVSVVDGVFL